jgi:hypothetical protein
MRSLVFLSAFLGSLGLELVTLISIFQRGAALPARYRNKTYWFVRLAFAVVAGLLPVLFEVTDTIHAFDIGICAPLLFHAVSRLRHV